MSAYYLVSAAQGPQGPKGDQGSQGIQGIQGVVGPAYATVSVGTVSSGVTAQVTNTGTQSAAVLNFVLPKGDTGDTGAKGDTGVAGTTDYKNLLNKPTLFSGSYSDLTNTPTLGTIASQNANSIAVTGGTINGTTIGATTAASGAFTGLTASSVTVSFGPSAAKTDITQVALALSLIS